MQTGYLSPLIHRNKAKTSPEGVRDKGERGREGGREGEEEGRRGDTHTLVNYLLQVEGQQLQTQREWATAWQVSRLLGW